MRRYNYPTAGESITEGPQTPQKGLFNSLLDGFGGPLALMAGAQTVLTILDKLSTNKKYKAVIGAIKDIVPAAIGGYKLYEIVKDHYANRNCDTISSARNHRIMRLLKVHPLDMAKMENDLTSEYCKLGSEIVSWLFSIPKTELFKVINFYDEHLVEVSNPRTFEGGEIYVTIEYKNSHYVLNFNLMPLNDKLVVFESTAYTMRGDWEGMRAIKRDIIIEFIKSFNTKENVITYTYEGLETRPRAKIDYNINQFAVDNLVKEIYSVFEKDKKRGYAFVGVPGTGKSSIILKMESIITDIPFLFISKSAIKRDGDIEDVFAMINTIKPCITIFEDLDCFGFVAKTGRYFNEFLAQIDGINGASKSVFIATLNDTSMVHQSLINRPGRFDQVYLISPPKTKEDIYCVMRNKWSKDHSDTFVSQDIISDENYNRIMKNEFTQADICELIDKIIINDMEMTNDSLTTSIVSLEGTKEAIKACNFNTNVVINTEEY